MRVDEVMSTDVFTVPDTAPFKEVVERLVTAGVGGLPVLDERDRLVGMVTETDLVSRAAFGGRRRGALSLIGAYFRGDDPRWLRKATGLTAREVMTSHPVSVTPADTLETAAHRMLAAGVKRLPVVDAGRLVGIVTEHDLLGGYRRRDEEIRADVVAILANPMFGPEHHHVRCNVTNGVVHLEGSVRVAADVDALESAVRSVQGVVTVTSELWVDEPDPLFDEIRAPFG